MPQNNTTVGRDVVVRVITAQGTPLAIPGVTGFHSKPDNTLQKVQYMNGETKNFRFPLGWSGSIMLERQDDTVDHYFADLEAGYYLGNDEQPGSIDETISEPDGSLSQYRYIGVMLQLTDAGDKAGDKTVGMSLAFAASKRIKVL